MEMDIDSMAWEPSWFDKINSEILQYLVMFKNVECYKGNKNIPYFRAQF